jgi:hypothetical protein
MGIFRKKSKLPPIENYAGYEASDRAFFNAQENVLVTIKRINSPKWALIGAKNFLEYLDNNRQKLPEKDFDFIRTQKVVFWDSFSSCLLRSENYGKWNPDIYVEVHNNFVSLFSQMPKQYRPNGPEWVEAAGLLLDSLNDALQMDRQILAQPIIEYVLIVWLHYCLSLDS